MNYQELIKKLYSVNRFHGMRLGLETVEHLLHFFGSPHLALQAIHIAGTNGKGSVTLKIASALQSAGYSVGLYTSPHIASFRERIRINGTMITEEEVVCHLSSLFHVIEQKGIEPSLFEITTALGFLFFAEKKVDYVVLETGLGGRLDATNICNPLLSVITSISLDHTQILGNTLEKITYEKAGIIKNNVPVVIGPRVPEKVILPIAKAKKAPLYRVEEMNEDFEEENRCIARKALQVLGQKIPLSQSDIEIGIQKIPLCRFEIVPHQILMKHFENAPFRVILDVAHNPDGIEHLFSKVKKTFPRKSIHTVYAASQDKDTQGCLQIILQNSKSITFVEA